MYYNPQGCIFKFRVVKYTPKAQIGISRSVGPGYWTLVKSCLSDDLTFISTPSGTAIPKRSKLISVRHTPVQTLQEVEAVRLTDRRLWLRIVNPSSKLSVHSRRVLKLWLRWLTISTPLRTMRPSFQAPIQAAADASAQGDLFQVGGFVASKQHIFWFAEQWHVHEIKKFDIPVRPEAQRDIACYETLAQAFLVLLCVALSPHACVPLHFKSLSDNAATEATLYHIRPVVLFCRTFSTYPSLGASHL